MENREIEKMSGNVVVLTPNGRRQSVKVTPNTTILQIIEEVCKKHGYKPEEYDIKHHRTVLDTTSILRFSGLPNNAQLELIEAQKSRKESDVVLGIHLEDGRRIMGNFTPSHSLWEVMMALCPSESNPSSNPVIIYMRQEVYGANLHSTSLRSLGLTNGKAMLRLIHRKPEELKRQANISAPLPVKPTEEKPYIRTFQPLDPPSSPSSSPPKSSFSRSPPKQSSPSKSPSPPPSSSSSSTFGYDKHHSPKADSPPPKKFTPASNKVDYVPMIKQEKQQNRSSTSDKSKAQVQLSSYTTQRKSPPVQDKKKPPTHVTSDEFVFLGERNAMVFSLETSQAFPSEDLPDEFYDLTITDAKKLLKDIKKRRVELENGRLLTSQLRQLEESKKQLRALNRYKRAIIRVQFPDRTVLQGTFTPTETVGAVMSFVAEYLEDKNMDFYVYTTPPKTILQKDSRLVEIGCVPGAILHFGTKSENRGIDMYLRKDLVDKFTSSSVASLIATKMRQEATNPNPINQEDDMEVDPDVNAGASTSAAPTVYEDYEPKQATVPPPEQKVPDRKSVV